MSQSYGSYVMLQNQASERCIDKAPDGKHAVQQNYVMEVFEHATELRGARA